MDLELARTYLEIRSEMMGGEVHPTQCPPEVRALCSGRDNPEICRQCLAMR